jgi:hypothetical protein
MDEVLSVYRIHQRGIWSSLSNFDRLQATAAMLTALDKHLEFQYTQTIRRALAQAYFEMARHARQDGNRAETGKHLISFLRNGGWQFSGSRRAQAGLAAYTLIGSWYKVFSRANQTNRPR